MQKKIILIAGATGNLGKRITKALASEGADVRVIVRNGTDKGKIEELKTLGATVITLNFTDQSALQEACKGVHCVVSALAGLEDVILGVQKTILDAAVIAGVPRFIPSDYSLDFRPFSDGENRNLDLRRRFHAYLDQQAIQATSIFNGAFMELLTNEMPMILPKRKLIIYWGKADHKMCFTTLDDTAAFTAKVALEEASPRYLRITGDAISPQQILKVVNELSPQPFRLMRAGGLGLLGLLIKVGRTIAPGKNQLYPAWQGMQYMKNMMDERCPVIGVDNVRYPDLKWTSVKDLLVRQRFFS